jgi:formylglycine-generating enzyme required for sulfatase activity
VKRFLNDLRLSEGLLRNAEPPLTLPSDALMRWSIVQYAYPGLAKLIKENSQYVTVLQAVVKELEAKGLQATNWNLADEQVQDVNIPASLKDYLAKREVVDLMKGFPSDALTLNSMVSMSGTATTVPEEVQAAATKESKGLVSEMVTIPKGDFLYGDEHTSRTIEKDFRIDIFPVTNQEFARFLEAGLVVR